MTMARERLAFGFRSVRQTADGFAFRTRCARGALLALLVAPLCACPQLGGHGPGKSDPAASGTARTPPADAAAEVLITTLAMVPGHTIAKTDGFDCRFFLWNGDGNYADKFQRALHTFRTQAAKQGAHAIVNLRVSEIPFTAQESSKVGSVVNLCGDEVELR